jgi:hypothetical protein
MRSTLATVVETIELPSGSHHPHLTPGLQGVFAAQYVEIRNFAISKEISISTEAGPLAELHYQQRPAKRN